MLRVRVIPCLLLKNCALVKTISFDKLRYIGDPINTVRIYNEQEVDELFFLDIDASKKNTQPNYALIANLAKECFMPFSYGGGVSDVNTAERIFNLGVEKISINSCFVETKGALLGEIAHKFGTQSVVASLDYKKNIFGKYKLYCRSNSMRKIKKYYEFAHIAQEEGAGEILLNSVDKDGTMSGYDLELIYEISSRVTIPVVALGGAGNVGDFKKARLAGASALGTGSLVVYQGKNRSVLTSFPKRSILEELLL